MKVGVLALQGDVREHARAVEAAGATALPVKTPEHLADVAALILPGGESTAIGKLLDRVGLTEPLKKRIGDGLPAYGTCAGAILMARQVVGRDDAPTRLGGLDIAIRRNAYGRQLDSFEADLLVEGLDEPFRGVFIRAPRIEQTGPGVQVLATHDGSAVLVREGNLFASTFHPEMTEDPRIHEQFLGQAGL